MSCCWPKSSSELGLDVDRSRIEASGPEDCEHESEALGDGNRH
jgi:hypothetical protein